MDEKKKKDEETNSSSLIPEQSSRTLSELIRLQLSEKKFLESLNSLSQLEEALRLFAAPSAASEEIHAVMPQPVRPLSRVSPSISVNSYSSMNQPPSFHPQETQSKPLAASVPVKSESSMSEPPDSHLQKTQRLYPAPSAASEKIHAVMPQPVGPLSRVSPSVSVKSYSSMNQPPSFHPQETQSEPLRETDSPAPSVASDSSMEKPINFNPQKKQSQLTEEPSSCSRCGDEQCLCSFWDQYSSTAGHSFERSERDQELQSVLLEKKIKRVEMETEKLQAEKEKSQAEKEKSQAEKEKAQAEKEKAQAEKEKAQAEKEKLELEKRKLALEIQLLEQQGKYTNYETKNHGVLIPNKGIPYIPYI